MRLSNIISKLLKTYYKLIACFFFIRRSENRQIKNAKNFELCAIYKKIFIVLSLCLFSLWKSIYANYLIINEAILDFWRPSWIYNGYLISLYSIYGNKQSFVPILLLLLKKLNFVAALLDFLRPSWINNWYLISLYSIYGNIICTNFGTFITKWTIDTPIVIFYQFFIMQTGSSYLQIIPLNLNQFWPNLVHI